MTPKKVQGWTCKHGCPVEKTPCSHLESLLPPLGSYLSVRAAPMGDRVEKARATIDLGGLSYTASREEARQFVKDLQAVGMDEYLIQLLAARFIDGATFKEITKEQHWTSISTTSHHYRRAIKFLRACGYKKGKK